MLADVLDVRLPDAGFYLWAGIGNLCGGSDTAFARALLEQYNVTVLAGSYLGRAAHGHNPGSGRLRRRPLRAGGGAFVRRTIFPRAGGRCNFADPLEY